MIYFFFIIGSVWLQLGSVKSSVDSSTYRTQITNTVVPPYQAAYSTLNDQIIQKLSNVDLDMDQSEMESLIKMLKCGSQSVRKNLHQSLKASEQISRTLDTQIVQLVSEISQQEATVKQSEHTVAQANNNVHNAQQQVTFAESAVQDKQNSLNAAQRDVDDAQRAVDKARLCGIGRRRKRGFGRWWRKHVERPVVQVVRNVAIKPVCSVVNYGGIDNAKDRRGSAERSLNEARNRLHEYQRSLENARQQLNAAHVALNEANAQLSRLGARLAEQKSLQAALASLMKQLRDVETHLGEVSGSAVVFEETMKTLTNFELVVGPLNEIYQEMINTNVMSSFGVVISADMVQKAKKNLQALNENKLTLDVLDSIDIDTITC